jgi:hypothetical protein
MQAVDDFNNDSMPPAVSNCLTSDKVLSPGEYLQSANGAFRAQLDTDVRVCIYEVLDCPRNSDVREERVLLLKVEERGFSRCSRMEM